MLDCGGSKKLINLPLKIVVGVTRFGSFFWFFLSINQSVFNSSVNEIGTISCQKKINAVDACLPPPIIGLGYILKEVFNYEYTYYICCSKYNCTFTILLYESIMLYSY